MDQVEARRLGFRSQGTGFFGRQVGHDDAVDATLHRRHAERLEAEGEDGIVVREKDERHRRLAPEISRQLEHAGQRHARLEGALGRPLDHRPVGQRIREGHAQLHDIGASSRGFDDEPLRERHGRIARGEVRDEGPLATLPELGEGRGQAPRHRRRHRRPAAEAARTGGAPCPFAPARACSTVCTSLSPRPESPITMLSLFFIRLAARMT